MDRLKHVEVLNLIAGSGHQKIFVYFFMCVALLLSYQLIDDDVASGGNEPILEFEVEDNVTSLAMASNGEYSIIGTESGSIEFMHAYESIALWSHQLNGEVSAVAASANGEKISAVSTMNDLYLFDNSDPTPLMITHIGGPISFLEMSRDGDLIAISYENTIALFHWNESTPYWNYSSNDVIELLRLSDDGRNIVAVTDANELFFFYSYDPTPLWNVTTNGDVNSIAISANGEYFAMGDQDNQIYAFLHNNSTPLWNFTTGGSVLTMDISANGEYVLAGSSDNGVYLFDISNSTPLRSISLEADVVFVSISRYGDFYSAVSGNGQLYYFDDDSGTPIWNHSFSDDIAFLSMSLDGSKVFTASVNHTISVFSRVVASIDNIAPKVALDDDSINVYCSGISDSGDIVRYIVESNISGEISNGSSPTVQILSLRTGNHTISLMVMDQYKYWSYPVTASVLVTEIPVANILMIFPSPAKDTHEILFQGDGTVNFATITQYSWRSSIDGELYRGPNSSVLLDEFSPGEHFIFLKVMSNFGYWSDEDITLLEINDRPIAEIKSISPNPAPSPGLITFRAEWEDSDNLQQIIWKSNRDGIFYHGTDLDLFISNLSMGQHEISLQMQDDLGLWSHEVTTQLLIVHKPTAVIDDRSSKYAFKGQNISLFGSGTSDSEIVRYVWRSSINGILQNGSEHSYQMNDLYDGIHLITLQIQDSYGLWSGVKTHELIILRLPHLNLFYSHNNTIKIEVDIDMNATIELWENTTKVVEDKTFSNEHILYAPLGEGSHQTHIVLNLRDGNSIETPIIFMNVSKYSFYSTDIKRKSIRKGGYSVIPIGEFNAQGEVIRALVDDSDFECTIESDRMIDVLLLDENDYLDYRDAFLSGQGEFDYYPSGSNLNTDNFSFTFTLPKSEIFYILLDNNDGIVGGASAKGAVKITYSLYGIESPGPEKEESVKKKTGVFIVSPEDESTSTPLGMLVVLLIVILGGVYFVGIKKGWIPEKYDLLNRSNDVFGEGEESIDGEWDEESDDEDDDEDDDGDDDEDDW